MAELIDKMQNIMCESCTSCEANWCDGEDKAECQWMQKIAEVGTATEAEIRAMAIDEFAEKLKESLVKNYRHFITTDTDGFDWLTTDAVGTHIEQLAEQMKEE